MVLGLQGVGTRAKVTQPFSYFHGPCAAQHSGRKTDHIHAHVDETLI